MAQAKYIKVTIDGKPVEISSVDGLSVTLSHSIEDRDNFQSKTPGKALNLSIPATLLNQKLVNDLHNAAVEDLTADKIYKRYRKGLIEANGQQLLSGKAFLIGGEEENGVPTSFQFDFYGDNADWVVDLKEATLYEFVKDLNFIFSKQAIVDSWSFDGTDLTKPYVFAPVRYALPLESMTVGTTVVEDYNMKIDYMKPALSKYWIIYNAFKSKGYTIKSDFFDTPYFRRQVMPWTWGNFLVAESDRLDNLDFLAKSTKTEGVAIFNNNTIDQEYWLELLATNDSINGAFDNNNVYDMPDVYTMRWKYVPLYNYGLLSATFHLNFYVNASVSNNSRLRLYVNYYKNGVKLDNGNDTGHGTQILDLKAPTLGKDSFMGNLEDYLTVQVNPGDEITCKIYYISHNSRLGYLFFGGSVDAFELDFLKIPVNGTVDFAAYTNFQKYKFMDFFAGVIDEFNLTLKTDPVSKIVYIEPQHPYSLVHDQSVKSGGYFNGNYFNWEHKHDLSKVSNPQLFSDCEQELNFSYKTDDNDGSYKKVFQRTGSVPGSGKYVFPDRFKVGKRDYENRFFSIVMHYDAQQWRGLGALSDSPQMIALIPENISNTSADEAQNTFLPKSAYYKGLQSDWGWVFDGEVQTQFPYMFAVNYKSGGENDPILSYCNEQIGTFALKTNGIGLIQRFYLQRLKIMENGQYYKTYLKLNNTDMANLLHREHIILRGQRWEIVEITDYKPLADESTEVYLRKWVPITNG